MGQRPLIKLQGLLEVKGQLVCRSSILVLHVVVHHRDVVLSYEGLECGKVLGKGEDEFEVLVVSGKGEGLHGTSLVLHIQCKPLVGLVELSEEHTGVEDAEVVRGDSGVHFDIQHLLICLLHVGLHLELVDQVILVDTVNENTGSHLSLCIAAVDGEFLAEVVLADGHHIVEEVIDQESIKDLTEKMVDDKLNLGGVPDKLEIQVDLVEFLSIPQEDQLVDTANEGSGRAISEVKVDLGFHLHVDNVDLAFDNVFLVVGDVELIVVALGKEDRFDRSSIPPAGRLDLALHGDLLQAEQIALHLEFQFVNLHSLLSVNHHHLLGGDIHLHNVVVDIVEHLVDSLNLEFLSLLQQSHIHHAVAALEVHLDLGVGGDGGLDLEWMEDKLGHDSRILIDHLHHHHLATGSLQMKSASLLGVVGVDEGVVHSDVKLSRLVVGSLVSDGSLHGGNVPQALDDAGSVEQVHLLLEGDEELAEHGGLPDQDVDQLVHRQLNVELASFQWDSLVLDGGAQLDTELVEVVLVRIQGRAGRGAIDGSTKSE